MRGFILVLATLLLTACGSPSRYVAEAPPEVYASRSVTTLQRYGDTDPHEWSAIAPWHYPVHGIDVSKYQGDIDWHAVRRSGAAFAFIKATEGGDHLDERFRQNWDAARAAGMPRGAYHYYYFCRSAAEQARWFTTHVPRDPVALPPVLDMEWTHKSRTCPIRPTPTIVRNEMQAFLALMERHYGKRPIIYTTVDFYRDNDLGQIRGYPFWLRSVADHPAVTYPNQPWTFWQYTGTGSVPGIRGNVDINAFAGSVGDWSAWLSRRLVR